VSDITLLAVSESLGRGGAEQALVNMLPALQLRGCRCEVVALHPPYTLAPDLERAGITVHRLEMTHRWVIAQGVSRLARLLRRRRYDIVHGHLFFAGLYVALTRPLMPHVQRVVTFHNLGYDSFPADTLWLKARKRLDAWLMRHWIDRRVAVSSAVATHYARHLGVSSIDVIPNGFPMHELAIDPLIDRTEILRAYGFVPDDCVLLLCGRLIPEKGHRYFLEALDMLRQRGQRPRALIVGDGPLHDEIAAEIQRRKLDGQVRLVPAVTHDQLLRLMQACDLVVSASTHEGFPLVPGEAMALSRPLVATRAGGSTDLVEDGVSGLLVPPADPRALADSIGRLLTAADQRERLGRAARRRIEERFSTDKIADVWMQYYRAGLAPGVGVEAARSNLA
jgi:glycosyltransferase involved in cell wall biosynthesis